MTVMFAQVANLANAVAFNHTRYRLTVYICQHTGSIAEGSAASLSGTSTITEERIAEPAAIAVSAPSDAARAYRKAANLLAPVLP
jgi:hypothetical protein